jgi:hypothetical protein
MFAPFLFADETLLPQEIAGWHCHTALGRIMLAIFFMI